MSEKHFGQFLRTSIGRLGIKKKDAAARIGVADVTLRHWFNQRVPSMRDENRVKLLGISVDDFESRLLDSMRNDPKLKALWKQQESRLNGLNFEQQVAEIEQMKKDGIWDPTEDAPRSDNVSADRTQAITPPVIDRNVEPYSDQAIPEFPIFEMGVAAGPWAEVGEMGETHSEMHKAMGYFGIHIRGDSMEPDYPDGVTVMFRCLRYGIDNLAAGEDYYVQRNDDATFKRLVNIEDGHLTFAAVNKRKYKEAFVVPREDIVRMAHANGMIVKKGEAKKRR